MFRATGAGVGATVAVGAGVAVILVSPLIKRLMHLDTLKDEDLSIDFARNTTPDDKVAVVVTEPLTVNEAWTKMAGRELKVFVQGEALE